MTTRTLSDGVTPSFVEQLGYHNAQLNVEAARLQKAQTYRDLSTIIMCPTRSYNHGIPPRVIQSWFGLIKPMNQMVVGPMFICGKEVGDAYETGLTAILQNPGFANYKYLLSLEDDILPPPDGLMRLYESIEGAVDGTKYDGVGGLYWTKGMEGQPMIYGVPGEVPRHFRPQIPKGGEVQPCNGMGMGFNLYRFSMFREGRIPRPFFHTAQDWDPHVGARLYTQDLHFYEMATQFGYRFACDTRVKCGHYDRNEDKVW